MVNGNTTLLYCKVKQRNLLPQDVPMATNFHEPEWWSFCPLDVWTSSVIIPYHWSWWFGSDGYVEQSIWRNKGFFCLALKNVNQIYQWVLILMTVCW